MPTTLTKKHYHRNAYRFVLLALRFTQQMLGRESVPGPENMASAHISGVELLEGIRQLGLRDFGRMARTVFRHWGITETIDFGKIVFELIEREQMQKTEHDHLTDFVDVYDLTVALDETYVIDCSAAFEPSTDTNVC